MKQITFLIVLFFVFLPTSLKGQIHYAGLSYIEFTGGINVKAGPYGNISYVYNFNNKNYIKGGISYFQNELTVLGNKEYSDVIHLEIPYFFKLSGSKKIYLNAGVGLDLGYEIAPSLSKYRSNEIRVKEFSNRIVFGGVAILELEIYLGSKIALVVNPKMNFMSSKITNVNGFLSAGLKILIN